MQGALSVVCMLVLVSPWTLKAIPVLPETSYVPQESFDLGLFMGRWYEVAVVSTCPHFMQRKRADPVIVRLELHHISSEDNFTMISTTYRNGSCKQTLTCYHLTDTPGRFFHHVARFGADVDSFVVQTDYDSFATMLQLSTEKPSGNKTTIAKLYSRTMNVDSVVFDSFKSGVTQHGLDAANIIMNQRKGGSTQKIGKPKMPFIKKVMNVCLGWEDLSYQEGK